MNKKLKIAVFFLTPIAAAVAGTVNLNTTPNPNGNQTWWDLMKKNREGAAPRSGTVKKVFAGINHKNDKVVKHNLMTNQSVAAPNAAPVAGGPSRVAIAGGPAATSAVTMAAVPWSTPDLYNIPNSLQSALPTLQFTYSGSLVSKVDLAGGIGKFQDELPAFCQVSGPTTTLNGKCIPIATPDTAMYPGSDFYAMEITEYTQQFNSDIPATPLRGYQSTTGGQINNQTYTGVQQYAGPAVFATRNKPVRVKFLNKLTTDLPLPVDTTYDGTGVISDGVNKAIASKKRTAVHLHGGIPPWISDGTPHQWFTPSGGDGQPNAKGFRKGFSFANVPDMIGPTANSGTCTATNSKGCVLDSLSDGAATFYWTNQQSGRMLWFHDHAYGLTRLNVYAGMVAPYFLVDPAEEAALKAAGVPGTILSPGTASNAGGDPTNNDLAHFIPLVIQDKTFVPDNGEPGGQLAIQDPTWLAPSNNTSLFQTNVCNTSITDPDTGLVFTAGKALSGCGVTTGLGWGKGSLWFPHVYMPNQFPSDPSQTGANGVGRWDYGPWMAFAQGTANTGYVTPNFLNFAPDGTRVTNITGENLNCTSSYNNNAPGLTCPNVPYISGAPESFMDTPTINGVAYPKKNLTPAAYQFHVLNGTNDRTLNLGIYYASIGKPILTIVDDLGTFDPASPNYNPNAIPATVEVTVDTTGGFQVSVIDGGTGYVGNPVASIQRPGKQPSNWAPGDLSQPSITVQKMATGDTTSIADVVVSGGNHFYQTGKMCKDISGDLATTDIWQCSEALLIPAVPHDLPGDPLPRECAGSNAVPMNLTGNDLMGVGSGLVTAIIDGSGEPSFGTGLPEIKGFSSTNPGKPTCWPNSWPKDGASGMHMVPDPASAGPAIIQIGSEAGLLPKPVAIPSTPLGFEYNRKSATVLSAHTHGLLLGPAERARILVDFTDMAPTGTSVFLLYNDAGAPLPGFDPRNDYYTGDADNSDGAGAPTTLPGYGPNTRTLMQMIVTGTASNSGFKFADLTSKLPGIFAGTDTAGWPSQSTLGNYEDGNNEPRPIVPEPWYPAGYGQSNLAPGKSNIGAANDYGFGNCTGTNANGGNVVNTCTPGGQAIEVPRPLDSLGSITRSTWNAATGVLSFTNNTNQRALFPSNNPPTVTIGAPSSGCSTAAPNITLPNAGSITYNSASVFPNGPDYCTQALAVPVMTPTSYSLSSIALVAGNQLYTTAPTASISGGGGGNARTANTTLSTSGAVRTVSLSNTASQWRGTPTVQVGGTCTTRPTVRLITAAGNNNNNNNNTVRLTGITLLTAGVNCSTTPTFTINGNLNSGNRPTVNVTMGYYLASVGLPGNTSGYTGVPTVTIPAGTSPTGITPVVANQATAVMAAGATSRLDGIALTDAGKGYIGSTTAANGPAGTETSVANATVSISTAGSTGGPVPSVTAYVKAASKDKFVYKGIMEGFTLKDGRMNALLVNGVPLAGAALPPWMTLAYVDPPSDMFNDGETQFWRLSHVLGVDTHFIHFHLVNVQLINRVGIDGSIRPINQNETGWREVVRMNPLEDVIVAVRSIKPLLKFQVANSIRPMDVTTPLGTVNGPATCNANPLLLNPPPLPLCVPFSITDPAGNAVTVTNANVNYGWEFVAHCHLLGHEENDMMRPYVFAVAPNTKPSGLSLANTNNRRVTLNWTDNTKNETSFVVQEATKSTGPWTTVGTVESWSGTTNGNNNGTVNVVGPQGATLTGPGTGATMTWTSAVKTPGTYYYRVIAQNEVGCVDGVAMNGQANNQVCSTIGNPAGVPNVASGWSTSVMPSQASTPLTVSVP